MASGDMSNRTCLRRPLSEPRRQGRSLERTCFRRPLNVTRRIPSRIVKPRRTLGTSPPSQGFTKRDTRAPPRSPVHEKGLEPSHLSVPEPKSGASANSATRAYCGEPCIAGPRQLVHPEEKNQCQNWDPRFGCRIFPQNLGGFLTALVRSGRLVGARALEQHAAWRGARATGDRVGCASGA